MNPNGKKIVTGRRLAGLCAAVYAQKCGYQVEVLEMHDMAGWPGHELALRRLSMLSETCLHWFFGSNPKGAMHAQWSQAVDVEGSSRSSISWSLDAWKRKTAMSLAIPTDVDRLERELLARAPQDAKANPAPCVGPPPSPQLENA